MYICAECNKVFSEPESYEEDYGWDTEYGHNAAYQTFHKCPNCGSDYIEEAVECCKCERCFAKDDMFLTDKLEYICPECNSEMEECEDD